MGDVRFWGISSGSVSIVDIKPCANPANLPRVGPEKLDTLPLSIDLFLIHYQGDLQRTRHRLLFSISSLIHAFGLSHTCSENGETTTRSDYPDPTGQVELNAYGFDIWEVKAVSSVSEDGEINDYMSYISTDPA